MDYGVSGGGFTRKPEWPLQESPGWKPEPLRSAGVDPKASLLCPQFWGGAPPGPGKPAPSPSSSPEKAQMELAWAGPWVGLPLPVISPAMAGPVDRTRAAPAAAVVTRTVLIRMEYLSIGVGSATLLHN